MADPLSWLMIERGWSVVDAGGKDVGKVEETVGDSTRDIFNGLTVSSGLFSKARYVPAERVGEITEGQIRLTITQDEVEHLDEYEEPPPSGRIVSP